MEIEIDRRHPMADAIFLLPAIAGLIAVWFVRPITQPENYHAFADRRTLLGILNFWDVFSNLPFAVVGIAGLRAFRDIASRVLFAGILLVAVGSSYYHLAPDTPRLAWDRAPMTVAFMALLALLFEECWSHKWGRWLLWPLIAAGLFSIAWWRLTGDLRLYVLVQLVPMLMILAALLVYRAPEIRALGIVILLYVVAKLAEHFDVQIYSHLPLSGHTLKHLLSGLATYWVYLWRRGSMDSTLADLKTKMPG